MLAKMSWLTLATVATLVQPSYAQQSVPFYGSSSDVMQLSAQAAVPTPTATGQHDVLLGPFTGTNIQAGRIFRDGSTPATCPSATSRAYPGVFNTGTTFNYETASYTYNGPAQCVDVHFETLDCGFNAHLSVYHTAYDPANQAANYIGDIGSSIDTTMGISLTPGQTIVFVVTNTGGQATCNFRVTSDYNFAMTAATEFAANEDTIRQVIVDQAERDLRATMAANARMTQDARQRFVVSRQQMDSNEAGPATRNNVAFDVDGVFNVSGTTVSTQGTFFQQFGNFEGTYRRLIFGDFNVQRNIETGSSTATLSGRVAWERMTSENTMLGYFIGGEYSDSSILGSFAGRHNRAGITTGIYAVHQVNENVFLDGFFSLGAGRNNLDIAGTTLMLDSQYVTRSATLGASLSGTYAYTRSEFRPSLSLNLGYTHIGNVNFSGSLLPGGPADSTLSLDAGYVSVANLTFRPEMVWGLDGTNVAESNSQFSLAPRFICQQLFAVTRSQGCGAGAELAFTSRSADGLSSIDFRIIGDRVGNASSLNVAVNFESRF